jgi:diguanylate cyclase (GGDEF)-like protein
MSSRPLKVLVVAEDRKHLRRLSKFLNTFGYETQQVADPHHVTILLKTFSPDFIILDGGLDLTPALSLCRAISGSENSQCPHILLMLESPQARDLTSALQVGVDDFLAKPVDYGEILTRLRSGARRREFERRFRELSGIDSQTGLPNRAVFCDRLQVRASSAGAGTEIGIFALLEIDFHQEINADKEWLIGRNILQEAAAKLLEGCGKDDLVASFGKGRFGIFLPGASEADALAWSERIRYMLNDIEFDFGDETRRVSISSGMVACAGGNELNIELLLEKAEDALQVAQRSGYNYAADWQECEEEAKDWADLAAPGVIFERTTVRDVMTPCSGTLRSEDTIDCAKKCFHLNPAGSLPVVNAKGIFQGIVSAETIRNRNSGDTCRISDFLSQNVKCFEENDSLENLKEFFAKNADKYAIVLRQGRPTGWVTPNNLLALGTFLNADSFHSEKTDRHGSHQLQVADI